MTQKKYSTLLVAIAAFGLNYSALPEGPSVDDGGGNGWKIGTFGASFVAVTACAYSVHAKNNWTIASDNEQIEHERADALQEKVKGLEKDRDSWVGNRTALETEKKKAEEAGQALKAKLKTLEEARDALQAENCALVARNEFEAKPFQDQIDVLNRQIVDLQGVLNEQERLFAAEDERAQQQADLVRNLNGVLQQRQGQLEEATQQLEALLLEKDQLALQLQAAQENQVLAGQVPGLQSSVRQLSVALAHKEAIIRALQGQLETAIYGKDLQGAAGTRLPAPPAAPAPAPQMYTDPLADGPAQMADSGDSTPLFTSTVSAPGDDEDVSGPATPTTGTVGGPALDLSLVPVDGSVGLASSMRTGPRVDSGNPLTQSVMLPAGAPADHRPSKGLSKAGGSSTPREGNKSKRAVVTPKPATQKGGGGIVSSES